MAVRRQRVAEEALLIHPLDHPVDKSSKEITLSKLQYLFRSKH